MNRSLTRSQIFLAMILVAGLGVLAGWLYYIQPPPVTPNPRLEIYRGTYIASVTTKQQARTTLTAPPLVATPAPHSLVPGANRFAPQPQEGAVFATLPTVLHSDAEALAHLRAAGVATAPDATHTTPLHLTLLWRVDHPWWEFDKKMKPRHLNGFVLVRTIGSRPRQSRELGLASALVRSLPRTLAPTELAPWVRYHGLSYIIEAWRAANLTQ